MDRQITEKGMMTDSEIEEMYLMYKEESEDDDEYNSD